MDSDIKEMTNSEIEEMSRFIGVIFDKMLFLEEITPEEKERIELYSSQSDVFKEKVEEIQKPGAARERVRIQAEYADNVEKYWAEFKRKIEYKRYFKNFKFLNRLQCYSNKSWRTGKKSQPGLLEREGLHS